MLIKGKIETKSEYLYQLKICSLRKYSPILNYKDFTSREIEFNLFRTPDKIRVKILQIKGIDSSFLGEFEI